MAQYRFDPIWNTYFLEEAENFSLVDGQDHTDPNAGVTGNAFDNTIIGNDADNPLDGAELEQNVREIFKVEPPLVAKLKEILK